MNLDLNMRKIFVNIIQVSIFENIYVASSDLRRPYSVVVPAIF